MNQLRQWKCHGISPGVARGEVLLSEEPILFYHTDPETGILTEPGHCLEGKSVAGKILVFPGGKGSSVVQTDGLYRLEKSGKAPLGFVVQRLDTVLVSTAILMEVPMVDRVPASFYNVIRNHDILQMNAQQGFITIVG
jgi:predicted aconitase with swiveling domain